MADLALVRRNYAEAIAITAGLQTAALIDALATVPREQFLKSGPWLIIDAANVRSPPRRTADDDPSSIYADVAVAIDAERQLFNGAPSFLASLIDKLSLKPGSRVLHVGAGLGYYSALLGHVVGSTGRVIAVEIDETLCEEARRNLSALPWVDVQRGDGRNVDGPFDAILVNAGVTHPEASWLDALVPEGRLLLPLTVAMPAMGATLGKGVMLMITRTRDDAFVPEVMSFVAIYSAVGLRDAEIEAQLGQAMRRTSFPNLTRLRRDAHDNSLACWLHAGRFCLSMEPID